MALDDAACVALAELVDVVAVASTAVELAAVVAVGAAAVELAAVDAVCATAVELAKEVVAVARLELVTGATVLTDADAVLPAPAPPQAVNSPPPIRPEPTATAWRSSARLDQVFLHAIATTSYYYNYDPPRTGESCDATACAAWLSAALDRLLPLDAKLAQWTVGEMDVHPQESRTTSSGWSTS